MNTHPPDDSAAEYDGDEDYAEREANRVYGQRSELGRIVSTTRSLRQYKAQVKLLLGMLKDWATGAYRNVPYRVIISTTVTLTYIFSIIDAIPDTIPVVGYLDDAALLGLLLLQVEDELSRYRIWAMQRARATRP